MSTLAAPRLRLQERAKALAIPRPELFGLLLLATVLNLWGLSQNGWANEYYSAAVHSMSGSWHNFLFNSFDSAGVMTVDKPPLSLWVDALSVKVFGFNSWAMLVPQALMGVASVALVYDLTRRHFGRAGGFTAGLVMALTPISVAIFRYNNPDALLVLCCVAALWFLVRAFEDGRTRWIVLSGVAIGLGFETKMAAALIVVPAMAAAWLWIAPRGRLTAVKQLVAGGGALAVTGLAWPVLVWLTPAGSRPWVSGTADNSIWSLIFGYNGLGRVDGQAGGPGGGAGGPGGPGGNAGPFGGSSGPLRLLNEALGGQGAWFLGFAIAGAIAIAVATKMKRSDARSAWLIAIGGSFATLAVVFSFAQGIFHPYYVVQLAPFTAAMVGAGVAVMVRGGTAMRVLAPVAIAGGAWAELKVLGDNTNLPSWTGGVMLAVAVGAAAALAMEDGKQVRAIALSVAIGALLIAPAAWSVQTLGHSTTGTFPAGGSQASGMGGPGMGGPGAGGRGTGGPGAGGPGTGGPGTGGPGGGFAPRGGTTAGGAGGPRGGGMFGGNSQLTSVLSYVQQHGGGTVAVASQNGASASVISSDANVAAIGGFSGRESQVSVDWLANAIDSGQIRWVLTGGEMSGRGGDTRTGSTDVMAAVAQTCKPVSGQSGLYDCQGMADALRAVAN